MKKLILSAALCFAVGSGYAQTRAAGHDHDHGHEHADDHGHGEHKDLGTTTVAGLKFQVYQMGKVEGKEGIFGIVLAKGIKAPEAIRVWVGVSSAEGSVKTRAEGKGPVYDLHVELPNPMPAKAQFWVEVQPVEGKKQKAAFDIKKD